MGAVFKAIGNAAVSVVETAVDTVVDVVETTVQVIQDPTKIVDIVTPANIANFLITRAVPGMALLDAAGLDPFDALGIPNPVDMVRDMTELAINVGVDFVQDPANTIEEGFSKDGYVTQFVEENVPLGGYLTAIGHAVNGNTDHANISMLKGFATGIETTLAVGGGLVGGPVGAAAGGALGAGARNLFEGGMHDLVPPEMQDRFLETSFESLATDMVIGAAMKGRSGNNTAKSVAKAAAKEGIEEVSEQTVKDAIALKMIKNAYSKSLAKDAGMDIAEGLYDGINEQHGLPDLDQIEVLALITKQKFEDRQAKAHAEAQASGAAAPQAEFAQYYDENLGPFWMRDGIVVWDENEAKAIELRDAVSEKGFGSISEYREVMTSNYKKAAEYNEENGIGADELILRNDEILGSFAVRNGEIIWGATDEESAKAIVADQLAVERGYNNAEAFRQEVVNSWRMSHEYDVEAGTASSELVVRSDEILGDYVIKEGRVVFGVTTEEEAEPVIRQQVAQEMGYQSVEEYQAALVDSYRQAHEMDVQSGAMSDGHAFTLRENPATGPFMVVDGEVIFGVKNFEEAQAVIDQRLAERAGYESVEPELEGDYVSQEEVDDMLASGVDPNKVTFPQVEDTATMAMLLAELRAMRAEMAELREQVAELEAERDELLNPTDPDEAPTEDTITSDDMGMDGHTDPDDDEGEDEDDVEDTGDVDFDDWDSVAPGSPDTGPTDTGPTERVDIADDPMVYKPAVMPDDFDMDSVEATDEDMQFKPAVMPSDELDFHDGEFKLPDEVPVEATDEDMQFKPAVMPSDELDFHNDNDL